MPVSYVIMYAFPFAFLFCLSAVQWFSDVVIRSIDGKHRKHKCAHTFTCSEREMLLMGLC